MASCLRAVGEMLSGVLFAAEERAYTERGRA